MATTKKDALTVAKAYEVIAAILADTSEDAISAKLPEGVTVEDFRAKFTKMNTNAHKPAKRSTTPSKVAIENANYAKTILAKMEQNPDAPITLSTVIDTLPYVTTSQKASVIVDVLLQSGKVVRTVEKINGHIAYKLV